MLYQFKKNDIFYNRLKLYPKCEFFIYDRKKYYNNTPPLSGVYSDTINHVDIGNISLYELNVDRASTELIYPFITKAGSLTAFKTVSLSQFNNDFAYGDIISSSYPLSATYKRNYYTYGQERPYIDALQNTLNYYKKHSDHYAYSSSWGDKENQPINLIQIPSIFYGSSIRKGSVKLDFYVSGTLFGSLWDVKKNGELIQVLPTDSYGSGSVGGVVLYNEGFIVLTGSWDMSNGSHTELYLPGTTLGPKWLWFASTGSSVVNENIPSSSFKMYFEGVNYVPTITMHCHAPKGELNYSNNPTFRVFNSTGSYPMTGNIDYVEDKYVPIKNIAKSPFTGHTASFDKITYISQVGIYDRYKNLIAVAKLAKPVKKTVQLDLSFKIRLDF